LSALHAYVSQFFARNEEVVNPKVWRCMDETALIALGILVEESAREISGETGDLVFTEGVEVEEESLRDKSAREQTTERWEGSRVTYNSDDDGSVDFEENDGTDTDDEVMDDTSEVQRLHDGESRSLHMLDLHSAF
jgi:hypothetical protein